jgi:hypothetical protein
MVRKPLTQVRRAANKAALASQERDAVIREAHEAGETIRAIATAASLSSARVHQILHGR